MGLRRRGGRRRRTAASAAEAPITPPSVNERSRSRRRCSSIPTTVARESVLPVRVSALGGLLLDVTCLDEPVAPEIDAFGRAFVGARTEVVA